MTTTLPVLLQIDDYAAKALASIARAGRHKPGSRKHASALATAAIYAALAQTSATVQASRAAGHRAMVS